MSHYIGYTTAPRHDTMQLWENIKVKMEENDSDNTALPNKIELIKDVTYENINKAMDYLRTHDREYREFAVPYLDESKNEMWLCKFEFHC